MVGGLPASAGDMGSGPGPGGSRVPRSGKARVPRVLSLRSGARGPRLLGPTSLEPVLRGGRGRRNERPVHSGEQWPPLAATGEGLRAATGTQLSPK